MTDPNMERDDLETDESDDEVVDDEGSNEESTLRISVAVPAQAEAVLHILRQAFAEQATLDPPSGVASEALESIAAAIETGQTIIALLDDEPVGTVRYNLVPDSLYLGRLGVLPEHRREGVATALVEWCQDVLAPAEDRRAIDVEVRAALPGNVSFFRAMGFADIGRYKHPRNSKVTVQKLRWRAK